MQTPSPTSFIALQNRRILLAVTGGIAAYKAAYLARELVKARAEVQVVMSEQAQQFVGSMTFAALTNRPVRTSLNDEQAELAMGHIELARWAEVILIAPASANTIGKIAYGVADNLLTTVVLASAKPLLIAPAMNQQMWANAATQANIATLRSRGVQFIGPDAGDQACGDIGSGRMREPVDIMTELAEFFANGHLPAHVSSEAAITAETTADAASTTTSDTSAADKPLRILLTAGPTHEPIDPVRYIGNRSSGRMGYAIAEAFAAQGHQVTLVSGPTCLSAPDQVDRIDVETANDMLSAVREQADSADIFIAVAAVADYRPNHFQKHKIKKAESTATALTDAQEAPLQHLTLRQNPDILACVAGMQTQRPFCVGFAAETQDVDTYALNKLRRKNLDMICANDVSSSDAGFGEKPNSLRIYDRHQNHHQLPHQTKQQLADALVPIIIDTYYANTSS